MLYVALCAVMHHAQAYHCTKESVSTMDKRIEELEGQMNQSKAFHVCVQAVHVPADGFVFPRQTVITGQHDPAQSLEPSSLEVCVLAQWLVLDNNVQETLLHSHTCHAICTPVPQPHPAACRQVDYGSVYASTTFDAKGRRLWAGWVYETSANCSNTC